MCGLPCIHPRSFLVAQSLQRDKQRVRISQSKQPFKKGYTAKWSEELFTISRINKTTPLTYVLKDDSGEELAGSFYPQEIQKVGDKQVYRISNIIQERQGVSGKEYLVAWYGYPQSFNSWIPSKHVSRYKE